MFKDLSCCFEKENLTSFFSEELNLLKRIENGKLRFASIESAAVVNYPLALLPKNLDQKIQSLREEVYFTEGFAKVMRTFDDMIPIMHFTAYENLAYNLLNKAGHSTKDITDKNLGKYIIKFLFTVLSYYH